MAEMAFMRILKIDPSCIEALIGIAVIRSKDDDLEGYFEYLTKAFKQNKNHPLVLLHFAEHFLLIGDESKAIKFCEKGLEEVEKMPKFLKL